MMRFHSFRSCLIIAVCLLAAASTHAQPGGLKADFNPKAEEAIKKMEMKLSRLIMSGKFDEYAGYLAEDYILTDPSGRTMSKQEILGAFKSSATLGDSLYPSNMKVRVYGETAILTGRLTYKSHLKDVLPREAQFTKIFLRRKGEWYLVSNQGSPALVH